MGAPLAWAGLSRIVMVVAVSFRKASDPSYSSIVGAGERERVWISSHVSPCWLSKYDIGEKCVTIKQKRSTWNIGRHVECGRRAEPFGGGCAYRELVRDTWVELWEQVVRGVGGQDRESRPLERHRGVEWTHATVADLRRGRETESQCVHFPTELSDSLAPPTITAPNASA